MVEEIDPINAFLLGIPNQSLQTRTELAALLCDRVEFSLQSRTHSWLPFDRSTIENGAIRSAPQRHKERILLKIYITIPIVPAQDLCGSLFDQHNINLLTYEFTSLCASRQVSRGEEDSEFP